MKRLYETVVEEHFKKNEQMVFLAGPRQVGKTTIAKSFRKTAKYFAYFNWDSLKNREKILEGYDSLTSELPIDVFLEEKPIIALDEIHKYKYWKNFLKGFIDEYKNKINLIVTGSSKLNIFRKGGDSLMGRYFLYQIHPLSLAELHRSEIPSDIISPCQKVDPYLFHTLFEFGGFPEPFIKQDKRFYNQWQELRQEQLFKEEIREISQIQDLAQMEVLAYHLQHQASQLINYHNLSKKIRVSDNTIRRWVQVLESFYYCFRILPWSKNISRSLLKEPKIYLYDWSKVEDEGQKIENFVACHLLKAVNFWTNLGFGKFGLYFIRDKDKNEVDFLMTKDTKPWILIEVKKSAKESLNKNLIFFQLQTKAPFAVQLAFDLPYIDCDFQNLQAPTIISLQSFLSQLI